MPSFVLFRMLLLTDVYAEETDCRIPIRGERGRSVFRSHWIWQPTWKYETNTVRGKSQQRYRDIKTGRFIKKRQNTE